MFLQLFFKALEQCEGIGSAACKSCDDLIFVESTHFARIAFHDGIALRDLAVAADDDFIAASHRDDGRAAILFQTVAPIAPSLSRADVNVANEFLLDA